MKLKVNGIQMYVEVRGTGLPIILLHGFPLDHTIWRLVAARLEGDAQVILPDLRGHGQTESPAGAYSMSLMAQDVAALMDILQIPQAVLVGHSMGGYASLAFARDYPQRLLGLGMVASQAAADTLERQAGRYQTAAQVEQMGTKAIAASMADRLVAKKELAAELEALILSTSAVGVVGTLKGLAERPDMAAFLGNIQVPATVVPGEADVLIPLDKASELAQGLPRCQLVTLPGVGHMPMLEAPEETAAALRRLW